MKSPATTKRPGDFALIQACDPARQNRRVDSGQFGRLNAVGNRFQFGAIGFFATAGAPIIQQQELGRRIGLDQRQADIGRAILVLAGEGQVERIEIVDLDVLGLHAGEVGFDAVLHVIFEAFLGRRLDVGGVDRFERDIERAVRRRAFDADVIGVGFPTVRDADGRDRVFRGDRKGAGDRQRRRQTQSAQGESDGKFHGILRCRRGWPLRRLRAGTSRNYWGKSSPKWRPFGIFS